MSAADTLDQELARLREVDLASAALNRRCRAAEAHAEELRGELNEAQMRIALLEQRLAEALGALPEEAASAAHPG